MTVSKETKVTIPLWLLLLVIPIAGSLLGSYFWNVTTITTLQGQIESLAKTVHEQSNNFEKKVDKSEYQADIRNFQFSLTRIEDKLDSHISK